MAAASRALTSVAAETSVAARFFQAVNVQAPCASRLLEGKWLHTSTAAQGATAPEAAKGGPLANGEPERKFRSLADKELWHEAWMYEDRFGTEESPIVVPSLEAERIIGVTDPEDDNLVVWGILRENEAPRQFIENGEFYVLKRVETVTKVGDVLEASEAALPK